MAEMAAGERNRKAMVVVWVVASVGIWVGLYWYIRRVSMRKAEESLVSMCEERARMLQDQFAVSVNHVHTLAILVSTFHYQKHPPALDQSLLSGDICRLYSEDSIRAYAQRVVHSKREFFESQQGWMIKTMKREPSPAQDEYAPVIYSQETVSYIEALDMMSGEEDRENI